MNTPLALLILTILCSPVSAIYPQRKPIQGFNRPLVSLTFDDGFKSAYETALPLLQNYNFTATFYVTTDFIDKPRYITLQQLLEIKQAGNEIGSHTLSHPHLTQISYRNVKHELARSRAILEKILHTPVPHFAPPYGEDNLIVRSQIRNKYSSSRSVIDGFNFKADFNPFEIKVKTVRISTPISEIQKYLNFAFRSKAWLVLVYHQIDHEGSLYSATPENLKAHLELIAASGIPVVTVGEALNEITQQ